MDGRNWTTKWLTENGWQIGRRETDNKMADKMDDRDRPADNGRQKKTDSNKLEENAGR